MPKILKPAQVVRASLAPSVENLTAAGSNAAALNVAARNVAAQDEVASVTGWTVLPNWEDFVGLE